MTAYPPSAYPPGAYPADAPPGLRVMLAVAVDGAIRVLAVPAGSQAALAALYQAIDCRNVDVVRLAPDVDMWVDDEGMFGGDEALNPVASVIAARHGFNQQAYYGAVVFSGGADARGNTLGLSPGRFTALLADVTGVAERLRARGAR